MNNTEPDSPAGSRDLASLLRDCGPLSPPRAVAIVLRIAAALDAGHAAGHVHGGIKAENISVTEDDFAYLADFGVAPVAGDQVLAGAGDEAADVYGLARVLTQCLTGAPPEPGELPRPSRQRPGLVPAELDAVVARGLTDIPADRYPSAGSLATAAREALRAAERTQVARILRRGSTAPAGSAATPAPAAAPGRAAPGTPRSSRRRARRPMVIGVASGVVIVVLALVGIALTRPAHGSAVAEARQLVLPFGDLGYRLSPGGVALAADGHVYVTSQGVTGRLVRLSAGSTTVDVLSPVDLYQPQGVAVDGAGHIYFADFNNRVVKLDPGTGTESVLPFVGLAKPAGVAVDPAGDVYVVDRGNNQVVKLEVGSNVQTVLPFGVLRNPRGVAVDRAGAVYVTDTATNRVLKLSDRSGDPVILPFTGIAVPWGITVDDRGSIYVTEYEKNKVAKLTAGSVIPEVLPFTGLNGPSDVAVDGAGQVYVADRGNDRVLKLPG